MKEDIQPTRSTKKLPAYVPPWKGKTKVPKDLDETKSSLQILLLPDGIVFEGTHLGRVPTMKFEDWDLVEWEKFPHLETRNLMKKSTEGVVTMLEPRKWLRGVVKVELLHLLWVLHFHHAPITIFVIKQQLYLVHDGYLWLDEPIPITVDLIHRIFRLPCKGKDLATIAEGKGNDLALAEAMKMKYKLEKKKRGYAISIIKDKGVCIATKS